MADIPPRCNHPRRDLRSFPPAAAVKVGLSDRHTRVSFATMDDAEVGRSSFRSPTSASYEPCRHARSACGLDYASLLAAVRRSRRCRRHAGGRFAASRSRADGADRLLGSALVAADGLPSHPRRPPAAPAHADLGNAALPDRLGPLAAPASRSNRRAVRGRTGPRSVGGQTGVGRTLHSDRRPAGSAGRPRRAAAVSLAGAVVAVLIILK